MWRFKRVKVEKPLLAKAATRQPTFGTVCATPYPTGHPAAVWNAVMGNVTAALYTEIAVEPLRQYYPAARVNQYGYYSYDPRYCVLDPGGMW